MTEKEREEAIEELLCYAECYIMWNHDHQDFRGRIALAAEQAVKSVRDRRAINVTWCNEYGVPQDCYGSWGATDALEAAHLLMEGWEPGEEVVRL